jgi:hypothetical protein
VVAATLLGEWAKSLYATLFYFQQFSLIALKRFKTSNSFIEIVFINTHVLANPFPAKLFRLWAPKLL